MKKPILLLLIFFMSCSKGEQDFIDNSGTDDPIASGAFGFSPRIIEVDSNENVEVLKIRTTIGWEVKEKPNWISLSATSGFGNYNMNLTIYQNNNGNLRKGHILFSSNNKEYRAEIHQKGFSLKLVSYTGLNGKPIMSEPKFLLFNKPVTLNYIKSGSPLYDFGAEENDIEYFDENKGINFDVGPSDLGGDFLYEFSVTDNDGNNLTEIVSFPFYSKKFILPGQVRKMILDDENIVWVATAIDNGIQGQFNLHKYQFSQDTIYQKSQFTIDLENNVSGGGDFFINPYNNLIYICDYLGNQIKVYNKEGGVIKNIVITSDELDHTQSPSIYPRAVGFTNSGLGIITLGNPSTSGIRWKYIDSANADVISSPQLEDDFFYDGFDVFKLNFDKSMLFTIGRESPEIKIYNSNGSFSKLNLLDYYSNASMSSITPNKLNNKIYVHDRRQEIIAIDGSYYSPQSYQSVLGDFSYDQEHPNQIYTITSNNVPYLELLDYNNSTTIYYYKSASFLNWTNRRDLKTTIDNKYIIMYSDFVYDAQGSQVIFFDLDMFKTD